MLSFEKIIDQLMSEMDGADLSSKDKTKDKKSVAGVEEEQAFVIIDGDPQEVMNRLYSFQKLGTYRVDAGNLIHIVDTFYDTENGDVRGAKTSLRVREANGVPFVTMKGKNISSGTSSVRSELEVEWPWTGENQPGPHDVAALFGMAPIQKRETERVARNIFRPWDGTVIAELALDKVSYQYTDVDPARVYEVEIEMKSDNGNSLTVLSDDIRKKFPELRKWSGSKFSMGQTLEMALQIKLDDNGYLNPESFFALASLM